MNMTDLVQAIRGGLIQQNRLLKTDIPSLPDNTLVPYRAVSRSELGRDFSVTLDMLSAAGDIELKKLIAQPMTLWIQQADKSYLPINGYVHTARRLGADGSLTSYQVTYASWMHFLKFRRDMCYWQDKSADEIITDVFNQHPQAQGYFQFALSGPLPQRSYCRQSETDWNFVHRLMEEEGLFGFWQHSTDGRSHTLVITDDIYSLNKMTPETVDFYRSGATSQVNAFTQWGQLIVNGHDTPRRHSQIQDGFAARLPSLLTAARSSSYESIELTLEADTRCDRSRCDVFLKICSNAVPNDCRRFR